MFYSIHIFLAELLPSQFRFVLLLCYPGVFMNYGLMEDVRSPVFSSVITTSGRIQSQFIQSLMLAYLSEALLLDIKCLHVFCLKGSFLEVFDNWSRPEPGVKDVVHRLLDLPADH